MLQIRTKGKKMATFAKDPDQTPTDQQYSDALPEKGPRERSVLEVLCAGIFIGAVLATVIYLLLGHLDGNDCFLPPTFPLPAILQDPGDSVLA